MTRSRWPNQVAGSGALSKALISSRERYPTRRRSKRFIGIAMTPRIVPNAVGAINPAYWRKERSAAKRAFRLRIVLWRSTSKWSRKALTNVVSISVSSILVGFMAEPQCNDCNVYTRLQHVHCSRVSNDVGRDVTLLQLRAAGCGCYGSQLEAICHTCSRHRTAGTIWEERAIAGALILT